MVSSTISSTAGGLYPVTFFPLSLPSGSRLLDFRCGVCAGLVILLRMPSLGLPPNTSSLLESDLVVEPGMSSGPVRSEGSMFGFSAWPGISEMGLGMKVCSLGAVPGGNVLVWKTGCSAVPISRSSARRRGSPCGLRLVPGTLAWNSPWLATELGLTDMLDSDSVVLVGG